MGQPGMHSVANIHHRQSSAVDRIQSAAWYAQSGPNRSMPGTAMTNRYEDLPNTSDAQSIEFKVAQMLRLKETDPEGYLQAVHDLQSATLNQQSICQ